MICSKDSGTILSQDDPVVPLSTADTEKACLTFQNALKESTTEEVLTTVDKVMLYNLLLNDNFISKDFDKEIVENVIERYYKGPQDMDERIFLQFLQSFKAPAYNYGQHLRRNAGRGKVDQLCDLIIRGCDSNTADGDGLTSLHYACEFNKVKVVEKLYELNKDLLINAKDKNGFTPLHCAVHHGSEGCVKLLIELGAIVTIRNSVGKTPLHLGAGQDRLDVCEILINAGGDLNDQDFQGFTPLHDAAYKGHPKLHQKFLNMITPIPINLNLKDKLGYLASDYLGNYQYEFPPDLPLTEC